MLNLILKVAAFGRGAFGTMIRLWGWSPHEWVCCLYERSPRALPYPFHHVRTQQKECHLWTKMWALNTTDLLVLHFLVSIIIRDTFFCLWVTQNMVLCFSSLNKLKQFATCFLSCVCWCVCSMLWARQCSFVVITSDNFMSFLEAERIKESKHIITEFCCLNLLIYHLGFSPFFCLALVVLFLL